MNEEIASLTLPRLKELRLVGNKSFSLLTDEQAIDHYTRCITETLETTGGGPDSATGEEEDGGRRSAAEQKGDQNSVDALWENLKLAFSNRALSHLRLKNYKNALSDAESALVLGANHDKSLCRKGKVLEGLEQYEMAFKSFAAAHELDPKDNAILKSKKRTKICMEQTISGIYNLSEFYLGGCKGSLDPGCDYVGPVRISKVPNAGRGLILTKDVTAGELLFVSNALAMAFTLPEPELLLQELHYPSKNIEDEHLISKLTKVAGCSPKAREQLYTLAYKPDSQLDMGIPSMDLFRPGDKWTPGFAEAEVKKVRICGVAHYSAFNLYGHIADISEYCDSERAKRTGLWPLAAFMNHSCAPNCVRMHIGHAMFVRAAQHIRAGEELTISYVGVLDSVETRRKCAKEWWGFHCTCKRCEFEEHIPALHSLELKFITLMNEVADVSTHPQISPQDLDSLFNSVEVIISLRANLQIEQRYWIIASCIYAYHGQASTVKNDPKRRIDVLRALVDSITSVSAANVWASGILVIYCERWNVFMVEITRTTGRPRSE